jgi:UDP-glucuronate 4-epimerase
MKVLVTGSAGFIGFHLTKRLLEDGYEVLGLDNINTYYSQQLKFKRLSETGIHQTDIEYGRLIQSSKYKKYHFIKSNLEDKEVLISLFRTEDIDIICNLAAQAGVRYSLENPDAYIQSNIVGFLNLLECCRYFPVKHLVYASSSSVYGNKEEVPYSENDKTDSPVSLYAATKKSNELMAYTYSHLYNIPVTGLRFFTVYGPYGRPDMAPMIFANAIIRGESIRVFNNGNLSRDFTYIDDIIEGVLRVMTKATGKYTHHTVYNIGCSHPVQLMDFIHMLEEVIGKRANLILYPMQQGDVYQTYADTTALKKDFGYSPKTSLKEGIKRFIETL